MFSILKYIGTAAERILTKQDLTAIGAEAKVVETLGEGDILRFLKDELHRVETPIAEFIAGHPVFASEFQKLSEQEVADLPKTAVVSSPVVALDPSVQTPTPVASVPEQATESTLESGETVAEPKSQQQ